MSSLKLLLNDLVDYAGLFPPASLPQVSVIKNYQKYFDGPQRWMLGRLIIPAIRLPEFCDDFNQLLPDGIEGDGWKISSLVPPVDAPDDGFAAALDAIATFNEQFEYARVDVVEGKLPRADLIDDTIDRIPESLTAYLEIPFTDTSLIGDLAGRESSGVHVKIRTGGITADLIPDSRQVAEFIAACAACEMGFKATAGLHHPLRGPYPLTYHTDADQSTMHGFLNVFVAACFADSLGWPAERLESVLNISEPAGFVFGSDELTCAGATVDVASIANTRQRFAISFGSCSFTEPVEELQRPGWLEEDAAETTG